MKKPGYFFSAFLIAVGSAVLISCTPGACFEETNAYLKATFYSNTTKEKKTPRKPDSFRIKQDGYNL